MKHISRLLKLFIPIAVFIGYVVFIGWVDTGITGRVDTWTELIRRLGFDSCFILLLCFFCQKFIQKDTNRIGLNWQRACALFLIYPGVRLLFDRFSLFLLDLRGVTYVLSIDQDTCTIIEYISTIISGVLFAPVIEELIFRKIFISLNESRVGKIVGALLGSFIFAWAHTRASRFSCLMTGVIFSAIYLWTGNIKITIWIHMLSNLFATVIWFICREISNEKVLANFGSIIYCDTRILSCVVIISAMIFLGYFMRIKKKGLYNGNIDG